MTFLTYNDVVKSTGGTYFGDTALLDSYVTDVVIDNRKVTPGALFVPIKGERFDGHDFIPAAYGAGAPVCISQVHVDGNHILVDSSVDALQAIAGHYRSIFNIPVYGITGSCGKTTTKELISLVLRTKLNVVKTQGNLNNQTGVPLTLFSIGRDHGAAVVEMGTNHFGEIHALAEMARPTHCFITNIGDAHIENFKDRRGTLKAKCEMLEYRDESGYVYVNGDDPLLRGLRNETNNTFIYGLSDGCDIRGIVIRELGLNGTDIAVETPQGAFEMNVPAPGKHMVVNALAAVCAGLTQQIPFEDIAAAIAGYSPAGSRMSIINTKKYTVLSDAYNANPTSVKASLDVLKNTVGRKVAIIGDMAELGKMAQISHEKIGAYAAKCDINLLICVGELSRHTYQGAKSAGCDALWFVDKAVLRDALKQVLEDDDTILVKASHSAGLEEIADFIALKGNQD